jgi:hypothetical protein
LIGGKRRDSNDGGRRINPPIQIRKYAIVVRREESARQTDLFRVAKIFGLLGAVQHGGEYRQGEAGQNRDDRDYDEQFN